MGGQVKPDTLLALLEAANQEAEEESENLMETYLQEGGSVEQFLENYQEKRKLAHMRRIKVDKIRANLEEVDTCKSSSSSSPTLCWLWSAKCKSSSVSFSTHVQYAYGSIIQINPYK